MKPTARQIAFVIIVALLGMGVALARVSGLSLFRETGPPAVGPGNRFCVGIEHPETRSGLVCTGGRGQVISEAVIRLGVPRKCGIVELPESLRPGDMVVLSEGNGRCGLKKIARLNGAHRLIMGKGLNINQDSIEDLSLLPGIGPGKAKWIIDNRKKNGPFKTLDELERVRGIGPTTVMRLKSWLEWPDGR